MPTDVYFPRINGVSTSIETFRASLLERDVDVVVVAPDYGAGPQEAGVVRVPARRVPMDPEDRLMRWRPLMQTLHDAAHPIPDLIHVQTPFAAHYAGTALARRLSRPVIATYHTHFEEYFHHYLPWLPRTFLRATARRLARVQCNALDAVVVPSRAMESALRDYGVEAPLHVLPTGIPVGQFAAGSRQGFRARHGIPARRPLALFVGRVAHEKNIGFLLEAMTHLRTAAPDLLLVVAGEGPALPALRAQAHRLGLDGQVRFIGYLDRHRELPDCYAAADVFVFASRTETQGLVLLEAMAAGLPVYALAEMGTREILSPGRGAAIAPDDPASFARGLAELLHDKERLARLATEGPAYAAEWSADSRAAQMADLYRRIAACR